VRNARVLAFAHLSHVYHEDKYLCTYLFHYKPDPEELWMTVQHEAGRQPTIQQQAVTISHQHGVASTRLLLPAEKGALGMEALQPYARS